MGRTAAIIDVPAIRRAADRNHLGTEIGERARADLVPGTIGAIENNLQVGKINAVQSGAKSIKNFAKLNLIPMAAWVITNLQGDAPMSENIFPAVFIAAYSYIVWG